MKKLLKLLGMVLVVTLSAVNSLPVDNFSEISITPDDTPVQRVGDNYIIRESSSKSAVTELPRLPSSQNRRVRSVNDVFLGEMVPGSAFALGIGINQTGSNFTPISYSVTYETLGRLFTRIEARDRATDGNGAHVYNITGGIGETFAQLSIRSAGPGFGINFEILFYVQADVQLIIGELSAASVLIATELLNVTSPSFGTVNGTLAIDGDITRPITMIDAIDQSVDDSGRFASMNGDPIGQTSTELLFEAEIPNRGLHFLVYIYGESTMNAKDFRFGKIVRASELLFKYHLKLNSEEAEIADNTVVHYEGAREITMIQGIDQNMNGTGASLVATGGGVGDTSVTLIFAPHDVGYDIEIIIEIYGL